MVINSPSYRSHLGRTGFTAAPRPWSPATPRPYPRLPGPSWFPFPNVFTPPSGPANLNFLPRGPGRGFPWGPAGVAVGVAAAFAVWYFFPPYVGPHWPPVTPGRLPGYRSHPKPTSRHPIWDGGIPPPKEIVWPAPPAATNLPFSYWYGDYFYDVDHEGLHPYHWRFSGLLFPGPWPRPFSPPKLYPPPDPFTSPNPHPWSYPPPVYNPPPFYAPPPMLGPSPAPSPPPYEWPSVNPGRPPKGTIDVKVRNPWVQAFFMGIGGLSEGWEILDIALDVAGVDRTLPADQQLIDLFYAEDFDFLEFWSQVQQNALEDQIIGKLQRAYKNALRELGIDVTTAAPGGFLEGLAQWQPRMFG